MKNNQLFNGSLIFFAFIIGSLIFSAMTHKTKGYKENNKQILSEMNENGYLMQYLEFSERLSEGKNDIMFVDLRDSLSFKNGHIKTAVNMPFERFSQKGKIKILRNEEKEKVLYSDSQSESALAVLFFKSVGVENIRYLPGNFDEIYNNIIVQPNPSYFFFNDEKARWDYKKQMGGSASKSAANMPQLEIKTKVKGGC